MAKIGTEEFNSMGSQMGSGIKLPYNIYFTKKDGFYALLPEIVTKHLNRDKVSGSDYNDVVSKVNKLIADFYNKGLVCKKVILYYLELVVPWQYTDGNGMNHNDIVYRHNKPFYDYIEQTPQNQVKFQYLVRYMIIVGDRVFIADYEVKDISETGRLKRWKWNENGGYSTNEFMRWEYMDHTEPLEQWFIGASESLGNILGRIADFFGADKKELQKNISKNFTALLDYKK